VSNERFPASRGLSSLFIKESHQELSDTLIDFKYNEKTRMLSVVCPG
jgi:hypothetical protein